MKFRDRLEVIGPSIRDAILAREAIFLGILQSSHKPFSSAPEDEHLLQEIETRGEIVRAVSLSLQLAHKN